MDQDQRQIVTAEGSRSDFLTKLLSKGKCCLIHNSPATSSLGMPQTFQQGTPHTHPVFCNDDPAFVLYCRDLIQSVDSYLRVALGNTFWCIICTFHAQEEWMLGSRLLSTSNLGCLVMFGNTFMPQSGQLDIAISLHQGRGSPSLPRVSLPFSVSTMAH